MQGLGSRSSGLAMEMGWAAVECGSGGRGAGDEGGAAHCAQPVRTGGALQASAWAQLTVVPRIPSSPRVAWAGRRAHIFVQGYMA